MLDQRNWNDETGTEKRWQRTFTDEGIVICAASSDEPYDAQELIALMHQLEDDGYAERSNGRDGTGWLVPWQSVYDLSSHQSYAGSLAALRIPESIDAIPVLESTGSLTDGNFSISIARWIGRDGRVIRISESQGALITSSDGQWLLSHENWTLLRQIEDFDRRTPEKHTDVFHRKAWAKIRHAAISANARLDDFLYRTVVLVPERLTIRLRKAPTEAMRVVEVVPSFDGCPDSWLDLFDRMSTVPDRYDLATREGIVQVIITPAVKAVLSQIKRMPGRRMAGARAEAFVSNPFAALGEDASAVIDPDQFEQARIEADLVSERFTAHVEHDPWGYPVRIGLLIEIAGGSARAGVSSVRLFSSDSELSGFIDVMRERLASGYQLCAWEGFEFELIGDSQDQIDLLSQALADRKKPRVLVSYARIYDLSSYSSRVVGVGIEKPYYSPFIAKKQDDVGWFPENMVPGISWLPEGESEPVAIPVTGPIRDRLKAKIVEARAKGYQEINLDGFPKTLSVREAETILGAFEGAFEDAKKGNFDPTKPKVTSDSPRAPNLVIKANIQNIDYEETRRDILLARPTEPEIPSTLRPGTHLKEHQDAGLAWLQHLFSNSPNYCRGCTLADDMGLGKTLQLLMLIAWAHEKDVHIEPALVVAPLSLLENWQEEIKRFFVDGALTTLTAYGDELAALRVPRASIDAALQREGLVKFLKPGWRGDAKIILTTYETLRDLEFSFAAEKWSIMVCDEAQKIKNPSTLMTRAAKKQKVRFKIACTGTPVENTLADLWCLFDFVQPGMLGALNDFSQRYRKPIEADTEEQKTRVEELRRKIEPQILRRTKKQVAKDLPTKLEESPFLDLSVRQRELYALAVEQFRRRNEPGAVTPFKNHLGLLHYLRLICTDPRPHGLDAFRPEPLANYRKQAPKLDWLLRKLQDIKGLDQKVIVFCEFRNIQRMLRYYIEETFGFAPDIINGDTIASASHVRSRQKRITAFQERPGFGIIILSPVAVGFGVNIQAANHVIHYTRTWNPAKEDQATDRAHRIGQQRNVNVYYPVVKAEDFKTFDVKLDELLRVKRGLADDMLNGCGDVRPGEFDLGEVVPGGADSVTGGPITIDDALRMSPTYFECLVAALWQARGYGLVERTPDSGDGGVDVVAIKLGEGDLVQCKSSTSEGAKLSWDAIKDVVTGEAGYRVRFPNVRFKKSCVTNQYFNGAASQHASWNDVELYDQTQLAELLLRHPVTLLNVERFCFGDWNQNTA